MDEHLYSRMNNQSNVRCLRSKMVPEQSQEAYFHRFGHNAVASMGVHGSV